MTNLFEKIFKEQRKLLKNISVKNKKLIICFSGTPGVGKTSVAKILEKKYKAVRISNHDLRQIIEKIILGDSEKISEERQKVLQKYLVWLIKNYKFKNKLIILDSSIDRKYNAIKKIAKGKGFNLFVINIKVNPKIAIKRIIKREKIKNGKYLNKDMKRWINDNKKFVKGGKIDFVLDNNKNKKLDLKGLGEGIEKKI